MDDVLVKINDRGYYLGVQCPAKGVRISRTSYKILKATGLDIEIYDPEAEAAEEARKAQEARNAEMAKALEEIQKKAEDEKKAEEAVPVVEETINPEDFLVEVSDTDVDEAKNDTIVVNQDTLDDDDKNIVEILNTSTVESTLDAVTDETKSAILGTIYTIEDLADYTRNELAGILFARGHIGGRDKFAVKQKDKRSDIIEKILATNPRK